MDYTLKSLQDRRSKALFEGDMPAYWAFDLLIGHALDAAHIYVPTNKALNETQANMRAEHDLREYDTYGPQSASLAMREWREVE